MNKPRKEKKALHKREWRAGKRKKTTALRMSREQQEFLG